MGRMAKEDEKSWLQWRTDTKQFMKRYAEDLRVGKVDKGKKNR